MVGRSTVALKSFPQPQSKVLKILSATIGRKLFWKVTVPSLIPNINNRTVNKRQKNAPDALSELSSKERFKINSKKINALIFLILSISNDM